MLRHVASTVSRIRWSRAELREFGGRLLSEPKPQVYFDPPSRPLARAAFERRGAATGVRLDPRTRLLYAGATAFVNGEAIAMPRAARPALVALADRRELAAPLRAPAAFWDLAYAWYRHGFLAFRTEGP